MEDRVGRREIPRELIASIWFALNDDDEDDMQMYTYMHLCIQVYVDNYAWMDG